MFSKTSAIPQVLRLCIERNSQVHDNRDEGQYVSFRERRKEIAHALGVCILISQMQDAV